MSKFLFGIILIFLGTWIIFSKLIPGGWSWTWSAFIMILGVAEVIKGFSLKKIFRLWIGTIVASIGAIVFFYYISGIKLWPIFLIGVGVSFVFQGILRRKGSEIGPGTIFVGFGILFMISELFGWWLMKFFWPAFVVIPGLGISLQKIYEKKEFKSSFFYLIILSSFLYVIAIGIEYPIIWGIALIGMGIYLIVRPKKVGGGKINDHRGAQE